MLHYRIAADAAIYNDLQYDLYIGTWAYAGVVRAATHARH